MRPTSGAICAARWPRMVGRELVAGLVDERAGEVLALADDYAFGEGGADGGLIGRGRSGEGE